LSIEIQFKSGVKWSVVGQFLTLIIEFVFGVVLARLLSPSDFGLVAILSVFIMVSQIFINSGLSQSLVRDHSATETDYSSIFFLNVIIGVSTYLILFLISPLVSSYFNIPNIKLLLRIVGLSVILSSVSIVFRAILTKNFQFKLLNNISIFASLIAGAGAIIFAYVGVGVWSIIIKTILNYSLTLLFLIVFSKWAPQKIFSKSSVIKHWSFGKNLLLSGLIGWIYKDVFALMLGRIISIDFLGFYNRSEMIRNLVTNNVESVITSSSYPVLSSLQNDRETFVGLTIKTLKFAFLLVGLTLAFIFSAAVPLVEFILGVKWMYSSQILKFLGLAGMFIPLCSIMINAISVYGRSDLYLKLQAYYALYFLSTLIFAFKFGENTFLVSIVAASFASYIHTAVIFCKFFSYSILRHVKDLIDKIFLIISVMLCLIGAQLVLEGYSSFIQLISLSLIFAVLVLLYFLISRDKEILMIYNSLTKYFSFLPVNKKINTN
jgi:teichuronic acid exporter